MSDFKDKPFKDKKNHFIIPENEVEKVEHKPRFIPTPKNINAQERGTVLKKGFNSILKRRTENNTSEILDDIVVFKMNTTEDEKLDDRSNFQKVFKDNNLKINALNNNNEAIVSTTLNFFSDFEAKLEAYITSSGKSSSFFEVIEGIDTLDNENKKTERLKSSSFNESVQDIQITLIPGFEKEVYNKVERHLKDKIISLEGEVIKDNFYLSDHTPILRVYLPSSAINEICNQDLVFKMDSTPYYSAESSSKRNDESSENIFNDCEIELRDDLPIICILDDGIQFPESLQELIVGDWVAGDIKNIPSEHGTKVASRAIFGDNLYNQIQSKKLTPKVKVINAVISDGGMIAEPDLIDRIRNAVADIHETTKIFNLSFNTDCPFNDFSVGNLAYELDLLTKKYDVVFTIPTGNHSRWEDKELLTEIVQDPSTILASPAESFYCVTVGGIVNDYHSSSVSEKEGIAPFSRIGPGFTGSLKPDLVYPGGNVYHEKTIRYIAANSAAYVINKDGQIELEFGTSFAAPLAAADLAILANKNTNEDAKVAKALLIHHAKKTPPMIDLILNDYHEDCDNLYGKGTGDVELAGFSTASEATYIRKGSMSRLLKERVGFYMPSNISSQSRRGNSIIKVKVTCISEPPIRNTMGKEYLRGYIDTSFHYINSKNTPEVKNPKGKFGRKKWHNTHHFSQTFSMFNPGDWQIWLTLYSKPEVENDETIDYILIVTIEDITGQNIDIYEGIQMEALGRFHVLNEVEQEVEV